MKMILCKVTLEKGKEIIWLELLLLLDEFSSALDPGTEEQMLERLTAKEGLCGGKTMIFITHRESILNFCDSELNLG